MWKEVNGKIRCPNVPMSQCPKIKTPTLQELHNKVKNEKWKINQGFKGLKRIWALRLKLYLELSFRILKIIFSFNFKLHFEPEATK